MNELAENNFDTMVKDINTDNYRVILADDHPIVREGLKTVLADIESINVVGEAGNGKELLNLLETASCDLVVLDIFMPELNGLDALEMIKKKYPQLKILVLTMLKDRGYFKRALAMGVDGYILKDDIFEKLVTAIYEIREGKKSYSEEIAMMIVEEYATDRERDTVAQTLTKRELEVLKHIANGLSNKAVARELSISVRTAEFHRANIMEKLDIHNVAGLVKFAINKGLV